MRWLEIALLLMASLGMSGCADRLQSQQLPAKWSTGFWIWDSNPSGPPLISEKLDVLFVHVGTIGFNPSRGWSVWQQLPRHLSAAREYWLVYRFERQGVPDLPAAAVLAREFSALREEARERQLNVAGIQLDIDSSTGALGTYANLLRELRKGLPPGAQISITALLDWFRDGTAISSVVKEVDEFVPQFYDLNNPGSYVGGDTIAAKFESRKLGARLQPPREAIPHRHFNLWTGAFGAKGEFPSLWIWIWITPWDFSGSYTAGYRPPFRVSVTNIGERCGRAAS